MHVHICKTGYEFCKTDHYIKLCYDRPDILSQSVVLHRLDPMNVYTGVRFFGEMLKHGWNPKAIMIQLNLYNLCIKAEPGKPFVKDVITKKEIDYESDMYSGEGSVPGTDPRKRLHGDATNDALWSGTCAETDTHSAEGSVPGTDPGENRCGPDTKDASGTGKFVVEHRQPDSEVDSTPKEDTVHIDKSNLKMDKCTEKVNTSDPEQDNDTDLDVQGTDSNNATRGNR